MANLTSPGVQVSVTDESVYGPAGAGTVPMLFIATGEDKADPTLTETDGIAKYTKSAQSKKPILVTSQRELTQYFGNVDFRKVSGYSDRPRLKPGRLRDPYGIHRQLV